MLRKNKVTKMDDVAEYIAQLSEQERIVLEIAKAHLGTTFDIRKSIGFQTWKKKNTS